MNDPSSRTQAAAPIPPDDPSRSLTVADSESSTAPHISVVGDTYTMLVVGEDTAGGYCLIDMHVPKGGGPPPHRHDFEEVFTILEGEVELTFRGARQRASAGSTVNIPANAPHSFTNASEQPARLLCVCTPAGQEGFFMEIGDPVDSRTAPPPDLTDEQKAERGAKAKELAPKYRTELLVP